MSFKMWGIALARLLKHRAAAVGIISARISGHSLRPGSAHEIIANGADLLAPADAGGWWFRSVLTQPARQ